MPTDPHDAKAHRSDIPSVPIPVCSTIELYGTAHRSSVPGAPDAVFLLKRYLSM